MSGDTVMCTSMTTAAITKNYYDNIMRKQWNSGENDNC